MLPGAVLLRHALLPRAAGRADLVVNAFLAVGVFGLIYGLASIGIATAFRDGGTRLVLNILVWIVLIAAAVAVRLSS